MSLTKIGLGYKILKNKPLRNRPRPLATRLSKLKRGEANGTMFDVVVYDGSEKEPLREERKQKIAEMLDNGWEIVDTVYAGNGIILYSMFKRG